MRAINYSRNNPVVSGTDAQTRGRSGACKVKADDILDGVIRQLEEDTLMVADGHEMLVDFVSEPADDAQLEN